MNPKSSTPEMPETAGWPEYERRRYEWNNTIGDLWLALSDHPLVRLVRPLRREFEHRAHEAFRQAAEAKLEAITLLAFFDQTRHQP